tara:strand:+ start:1430 stop:2314 length:885 start_codon:yes stop_codon:yes gene_type:complete
MKDNKTRSVDVKLENGETVKIKVTRPSNTVITDAQRISAKVWTDCVRDGIMTKKELAKFMRKQKIWDKEQENEENELKQEIIDLEKSLYLGGGKKPVPLDEGKKTAIEIRRKRNELRDLIGERLSLEGNTAEALADNARFDYLVTRCTTYEDGKLVYNSVEEYSSNSDDEIAFSAATTLAEMMYSLEDDFEKKLPENKFLLEFNLVNKDLSLVNKEGETVDLEGRKINEFGQYVNEKGERTDSDGNALEEDGTYVLSTHYVDSEGKPVSEKKPTAKKKTTTKKTKAVSTESNDG